MRADTEFGYGKTCALYTLEDLNAGQAHAEVP